MRRLVLGLVVMVILAGLVLAVAFRIAERQLDARKAELAALEQQAKQSHAQAEAIVESGQYDLHVEIATSLVAELVQELVDYEQITTRGNRFVIRALQPEFSQGSIVLKAQGDFAWRFGFYHGKVEVIYHGYTQLNPNGECFIHLRVFDARALDTWSFFNRWLAPILTIRLQDKLKIPDLRLPLDYSDRIELPRLRKEIPEHETRITIPERDITLAAERPLLYATSEGVGLVIERIDMIGGRVSEPFPTPADSMDGRRLRGLAESARGDTDVVFSISHDLLVQMISWLTRPDEDVLIYIERIPGVWEKRGELFGKPYHYTADISHFSGYVDIFDAILVRSPQGLELEFGLRGEMHGTLSSSIAGIRLPTPFKVMPALHDSVPVTWNTQTMELTFEDKTLDIDLRIETSIGSWAFQYDYPFHLDMGSYFQPVKIPAVVQTTMSIPTFVSKREIKRVKRIPLTVDWSMEAPQEHVGVYTFLGRVAPQFDRAEEVELIKDKETDRPD